MRDRIEALLEHGTLSAAGRARAHAALAMHAGDDHAAAALELVESGAMRDDQRVAVLAHLAGLPAAATGEVSPAQ